MGTILQLTLCAFACALSVGNAASKLAPDELHPIAQPEQDSRLFSALIQRIENLESRVAEHGKKEMEYQAEVGELRKELGIQKQTNDEQQSEIERLTAKDNGLEAGDEESGLVQKDASQQEETFATNVGPSRRASTNYAVAFFASVAAQLVPLEPNGTVIFEAIDSNESGAYDNDTGIFTTPVTGSYVFSMTVGTFGTYKTHVGLVRNGERLTQLWVDGQEQAYGSASQTTLLHLQKDDLVTVRQTPDEETYIYGLGHTMWTGFLLFATF